MDELSYHNNNEFSTFDAPDKLGMILSHVLKKTQIMLKKKVQNKKKKKRAFITYKHLSPHC